MDCPVGLAAFRRRVAGLGSAIAAGFLLLVGGLGFGAKTGAIHLPSAKEPVEEIMGGACVDGPGAVGAPQEAR